MIHYIKKFKMPAMCQALFQALAIEQQTKQVKITTLVKFKGIILMVHRNQTEYKIKYVDNKNSYEKIIKKQSRGTWSTGAKGDCCFKQCGQGRPN